MKVLGLNIWVITVITPKNEGKKVGSHGKSFYGKTSSPSVLDFHGLSPLALVVLPKPSLGEDTVGGVERICSSQITWKNPRACRYKVGPFQL